MTSPTLSIVIPTLNEAEHLPTLLSDIKAQKNIEVEIIAGDGGSTDGTQEILGESGAMIVSTARGRGTQMNGAAGKASGDYLFFLHADSRIEDKQLLSNALNALRNDIDQDENLHVAGHFALRFIRTTHSNAMAYRYMEEKTAFNRTNTTNGDQGFLMTREYFEHLGGFNEKLPFLEDQELAEKIRKEGRWITLPGTLYTSARRFEIEDFHRRYILMGIIMGLYSTGVDSFFHRTPHLYQTQQETGKLLMTPFFRVIWQIMRKEMGIWGSIRAWFYVGRYVRQNSWQMFYFLDVWARPRLGPGRYPFLSFHDNFFRRLTNFAIFDGICATFCFVWFMGFLAPYFWLRERWTSE